MKRILLLLLLCTSFIQYGQTLSKDRIIYEHKDQIVMNDGMQYKVLVEKSSDKISDPSIELNKRVVDHVFTLKRFLVVRSKTHYKELIEWTMDNMKYYQVRELSKENLKQGHSTTSKENGQRVQNTSTN